MQDAAGAASGRLGDLQACWQYCRSGGRYEREAAVWREALRPSVRDGHDGGEVPSGRMPLLLPLEHPARRGTAETEPAAAAAACCKKAEAGQGAVGGVSCVELPGAGGWQSLV